VETFVVASTGRLADGTFGWICLYEAATRGTIRHHATAAALPIADKVAGAFVVRPHPAATAARRGGMHDPSQDRPADRGSAPRA
jgi:hypothetical protein